MSVSLYIVGLNRYILQFGVYAIITEHTTKTNLYVNDINN